MKVSKMYIKSISRELEGRMRVRWQLVADRVWCMQPMMVEKLNILIINNMQINMTLLDFKNKKDSW